MHYKKFTWFSLSLFLICFILILVVKNISRPRIIILQSYTPSFSWTRDIDVGIKKILDQYTFNTRWHYMDTKRHPSKEYKQRAGETARKMINQWKPDVIIAIDDNAQHYVATHYINHPTIRIVFAGVNKTLEDYNYDTANNVTGMLERINYAASKDILLQVLPSDKRRIKHISDSSTTSMGIHDEMQIFDWSPLEFTESVQVNTLEEWEQEIKKAEDQVDFILFTHYHTLKRSVDDKQIVPAKEVIEWTNQNSSLPGISFWGFYVEDGGMMAVALSPFEQGEFAARMAVDLIKGKPIKDIPIETNHLFLVYMRKNLIDEKLDGLRLPLVYEAFSKATHNYYE